MKENYSEEHKHYVSEIFATGAHKLFGELLGYLCDKAIITQSQLGQQAKDYRDYLILKGYLASSSNTKYVDQPGISRVIAGKRPISYAQAYIWLKVLRDVFESDEYKNRCETRKREKFKFTEEWETDMWRLALGGTPMEVFKAYEKRKDMLQKQRQDDT